MKLPFSVEQFLNVFERYNLEMWPSQIGLLLLAVVAIIAVLRQGRRSGRIVSYVLAFLWIWMGLIYHILYFSPINPIAFVFGTLFIAQALLFLYTGIRQKIEWKFEFTGVGLLGLLFIIYALIDYPLMGYFLGREYPRTPTFGVPCPTTIFTLGLLLCSVKRVPWYLTIIPILWSVVGFSAAINLQMKEDYWLALAGLVFVIVEFFLKPKLNQIQYEPR